MVEFAPVARLCLMAPQPETSQLLELTMSEPDAVQPLGIYSSQLPASGFCGGSVPDINVLQHLSTRILAHGMSVQWQTWASVNTTAMLQDEPSSSALCHHCTKTDVFCTVYHRFFFFFFFSMHFFLC